MRVQTRRFSARRTKERLLRITQIALVTVMTCYLAMLPTMSLAADAGAQSVTISTVEEDKATQDTSDGLELSGHWKYVILEQEDDGETRQTTYYTWVDADGHAISNYAFDGTEFSGQLSGPMFISSADRVPDGWRWDGKAVEAADESTTIRTSDTKETGRGWIIADVVNSVAESVTGAVVDVIDSFIVSIVAPLFSVIYGNMMNFALMVIQKFASVFDTIICLCTFNLSGDAGNAHASNAAGTAQGSSYGGLNDAEDAISVFVNILAVADVAFMPTAKTLLALVFAIRAAKLLMSPDLGRGGVPYVEKIFWMMFEFAFLYTLLTNSTRLAFSVMNIFGSTAVRVDSVISASFETYDASKIANVSNIVTAYLKNEDPQGIFNSIESLGVGHMMATVSQMVIHFLIIGLCFVICAVSAYIATYARWIQMSIYLMCAPIFFALYGLDETRDMFLGYIRSLISLGLAFVLTVVIIRVCSGMMCNLALDAISEPNTLASWSMNGTLGIIVWSFLFKHALGKTGEWANDLVR